MLGAQAVLPKGIGLPELMTALRRVLAGEQLHPEPAEDASEHRLTRRETEVLQLLAAGRDPQQIARALGVSTHTVRDQIRNVRAKLGVQAAELPYPHRERNRRRARRRAFHRP